MNVVADITVTKTNIKQGCAINSSSWWPAYLLLQVELKILVFFIEIVCWVPWISQAQGTGFPSIFLRVQPC